MIGLLTNARQSYRFDVRQFHRMVNAGVFGDQKVELVAGSEAMHRQELAQDAADGEARVERRERILEDDLDCSSLA